MVDGKPYEAPTVELAGDLRDKLAEVTTPSSSPHSIPVDTSNASIVARNRDGIVIMGNLRRTLSDDEAINLAAWLCAMTADGGGPKFAAVLHAVKNT